MAKHVPLLDLAAQQGRLRGRLDAAINEVLAHGQYILGPQVRRLEEELEQRFDVKHVVSCASGTDALVLMLLGCDLGAGDGVFIPAFTFAATAEAVVIAGATPVFVDVDPSTYTLSPESLGKAISEHKDKFKRMAILAVDLFGHPADYSGLEVVATAHDMLLLTDAAQALGAQWRARSVASVPRAAATSFFPSKPLGCYGDGGAVFLSDDDRAGVLRSLRVHGQGAHKYDNVRVGFNSRLDTLQAAVLLAKLTIFDEDLTRRADIAARYSEHLGDVVQTPFVHPDARPAWPIYTVRTLNRDRFVELLRADNVSTAIYYPRPLHLQPAYRHQPRVADLAVSEQLALECVALPMYAELSISDQDRVIAAVVRAA